MDQLKLLLDSEGANIGDADWRGMLAAISILKDQPFNPDADTRAILDWAAKELASLVGSMLTGTPDASGNCIGLAPAKPFGPLLR